MTSKPYFTSFEVAQNFWSEKLLHVPLVTLNICRLLKDKTNPPHYCHHTTSHIHCFNCRLAVIVTWGTTASPTLKRDRLKKPTNAAFCGKPAVNMYLYVLWHLFNAVSLCGCQLTTKQPPVMLVLGLVLRPINGGLGLRYQGLGFVLGVLDWKANMTKCTVKLFIVFTTLIATKLVISQII